MAANEIHLNDIGTVFEITLMDGDVVVPLDTATSLQVLFLKPDQSIATKTATLKTDGTDGILQYTTIDGDLSAIGKWKVQARVETPEGKWSSDIQEFKVYKNLD